MRNDKKKLFWTTMKPYMEDIIAGICLFAILGMTYFLAWGMMP